MPSHLISAWNCLAQRSPVFATCQPTTSEAQWSTAAKTQHQPSAFVQNRDASVPPELVRPVGPDPAAVGPVPAGMPPPHRCQQPVLLHQPFLPARIPLAASRAFTLRWPSPRNGLAFTTVRVSSTSSSSLSAVFGPRFPGCRRSDFGGPPCCARSTIHARACDPPRLAHHRQRTKKIGGTIRLTPVLRGLDRRRPSPRAIARQLDCATRPFHMSQIDPSAI